MLVAYASRIHNKVLTFQNFNFRNDKQQTCLLTCIGIAFEESPLTSQATCTSSHAMCVWNKFLKYCKCILFICIINWNIIVNHNKLIVLLGTIQEMFSGSIFTHDIDFHLKFKCSLVTGNNLKIVFQNFSSDQKQN